MAEKTEIAWCDSTFNPWIGCQKVSAGCDNCYAETLMDKRYHRVQWGPHGDRVRTSAAYWRNPLKWERGAGQFFEEHGHRRRVFCASLADVFDNRAPAGAREDLWRLIDATPNLDWLLLTKRPENILKFIPRLWQIHFPDNIWLGTTAEDQAAYDRRWPILREVPALVRFISYEPAIGHLRIAAVDNHMPPRWPDWIICGGESGFGYRTMPAEWAWSMQEQCDALGIPFFMKQMAGKKPIPADLLVREFPVAA